MIKLLSGRPGSGKSYNMAKLIAEALLRGQNVITTVPIDIDYISRGGRRKLGIYLYKSIHDITPEDIYKFMIKHHKKGDEVQTKLFLDECQMIFNSRHWNQPGRMEWLRLFTIHRHLGFDVFLITQSDSFLDKQIRPLIEIEIKHKKVNTLAWWFPLTVFVHREELYSSQGKHKLYNSLVFCRKKVFRTYDSYTTFNEIYEKYKHLVPEIEDNNADWLIEI